MLFAFMSCLDPGDEIIITDPFYANYMAFAISAGAVIKSVKTSIENGFRLPSIEAFEEQITPRTKAILICNPNKPTGYLYTRAEMKQLRDIVKKHNLFLFSDEVYREFVYSGTPYISAFHLHGIEENVILIDSVSKRYSECGVRIGCLCTKNKEVREAVMKICQARLNPRLLGLIVGIVLGGKVLEHSLQSVVGLLLLLLQVVEHRVEVCDGQLVCQNLLRKALRKFIPACFHAGIHLAGFHKISI